MALRLRLHHALSPPRSIHQSLLLSHRRAPTNAARAVDGAFAEGSKAESKIKKSISHFNTDFFSFFTIFNLPTLCATHRTVCFPHPNKASGLLLLTD